MPVELSAGTLKRLEQLFATAERQSVIDLLVTECGNNLPLVADGTPESLERIRFAVLKLSGGDTMKLLDAIRLAQVDWRDVLVAAGFGYDVHAHAAWWP